VSLVEPAVSHGGSRGPGYGSRSRADAAQQHVGPPGEADAGRRSPGTHLALIGLLVVLALLAWWRVWVTGHPASSITCGCGDPSQELWLFAWVPHALSHGVNPLFTNLLDAGQGGVNVMWDANNLLAAFLLAPVTASFGPVASFNAAAVIGPVLSGWCFFLAAGRVSRFVPGQMAGAVLYAFSPFVIWNSPFGHANLTWLFFPPLLFLLAYDLWTRPSRPSATIGRWMGVLIAVQFLASSEVLVLTAIGSAVGGVLVIAGAPRTAWALKRRVGIAAGWAAAISLPLVAYPAWYAIAGPRHIVGAPWSSVDLQTQVLHASTILHATGFRQNTPLEQVFGYYGGLPPTFFLGGVLLAFLVVSAVVWYRDARAWLMVGVAAVTTLFSLGAVTVTVTPLSLVESAGHWWMPWRLFAALPILRDLQPYRFVIVTGFAISMLVTIAAEQWWHPAGTPGATDTTRMNHTTGTRPGRRWYGPAARATVISLVLAGVLWSVADVYDLPFVVHRQVEPAWFRRDAPRLTAGTRVLALPTGFPLVTRVMSWQAESGLHFALEGGYAVVPGPSSLGVYSLAPIGAAAVLDRLSSGQITPTSAVPDIPEVRRAFRSWGVGVVALDGSAPEAVPLHRYMVEVIGTSPLHVGTWWIWDVSS